MLNKQKICDAFCGDLNVREMPSGLAVSTGFKASDGDAIDFYIKRHPMNSGKYRLEDSGMVIPMLEASGFNLQTGTRATAFRTLLSEHKATFDEDALGLHTDYLEESDLPSAAMRFLTLMIRVRDLELLNPETVESTFREDAEQALRDHFSNSANIEFRKQVPGLEDYVADALIQPTLSSASPLALYFATNENKVDEAVMLWMESRFKPGRRLPKVALLLETEKPTHVSGRSLRRAMNRVNMATFRGDEDAAMARIASYVEQQAGYPQ